MQRAQQLSLAEDAYVWGFPRMIYAKYLRDFRRVPAPFNVLFAMDRMATPDHGGVNVDTLYGVAWLDVGPEPVVIHVPEANDRYWSIQMIDQYANNFCYLGRRTTGTRAQTHLVVGPDWNGEVPIGLNVVRATGRYVFCFLRTLIDDAADLPAANAFDHGIAVGPLSRYPHGLTQTQLEANLAPWFPVAHSHLDRLGTRYFDILCEALETDPPTRPEDLAAIERFAAIGIAPGRRPVAEQALPQDLFDAAQRDAYARIFAATANQAFGGWSVNMNFDAAAREPMFKATVNRMGLGMVGVEEAIYLLPTSRALPDGAPVPAWSSCGPDDLPFDGSRRYRLRFPPGQLPQVDAFWSLTMYAGDLSLVRNPLERYAIGDRTRGLAYGDDGSLDILIQHEPPAEGTANWLPAPAGTFHLFFRGYQPRASFLAREYWLPPIELVD